MVSINMTGFYIYYIGFYITKYSRIKSGLLWLIYDPLSSYNVNSSTILILTNE